MGDATSRTTDFLGMESTTSNASYQLAMDFNVTTFNATIVPEKRPQAWTVVVVVLLCLLIAVTVVGNTLVIAAVLTTRRLRTVTNCFVTSLAVADWLVAVFVMPPAIAYYVMDSWRLGAVLCDLWVSLDVLLCTASILSLGAISVDRYLAVTQPLLYSRRRRSKRLALTMILIVWLLAAAITCPPMLGWYDKNRHINQECTYNENIGYVVFSALGSFFVPLVVMLYVYARISCVIARRMDPLEQAAAAEHDAALGASCRCSSRSCVYRNSGAHHNHSSARSRVASLRRETKTAQTLSLVVGGFVLCWLPFFVLYLVKPFLRDSKTKSLKDLQLILCWLGWINSAINPFIYAFYSADFRIAFHRLTVQRLCQCRKVPNAFTGAAALADPLSRGNSQHSSVHHMPFTSQHPRVNNGIYIDAPGQ